jgi:hypothetical protein
MREVPRYTDNTAALVAPRLVTRREAAFACVFAAMAVTCSAGLCIAAVLLHPPLGVVPLLVIVCVGTPAIGTWQLPHAVAALRARRVIDRQAIAVFRRSLDQLPETEHPLGH